MSHIYKIDHRAFLTNKINIFKDSAYSAYSVFYPNKRDVKICRKIVHFTFYVYRDWETTLPYAPSAEAKYDL